MSSSEEEQIIEVNNLSESLPKSTKKTNVADSCEHHYGKLADTDNK